MSLKDLKIKTGILKRLDKELISYKKEYQTQTNRIQKLVDNKADEHDIRKQVNSLKFQLHSNSHF